MNLQSIALLLQLVLSLLESHPSPQSLALAQQAVSVATTYLGQESAPASVVSPVNTPIEGVGGESIIEPNSSLGLISATSTPIPSFCPSLDIISGWNDFAKSYNNGGYPPGNWPRQYWLEVNLKNLPSLTKYEASECGLVDVPSANFEK